MRTDSGRRSEDSGLSGDLRVQGLAVRLFSCRRSHRTRVPVGKMITRNTYVNIAQNVIILHIFGVEVSEEEWPGAKFTLQIRSKRWDCALEFRAVIKITVFCLLY